LHRAKVKDFAAIREALFLGKRLTGSQAQTLGLIDRALSQEKVLQTALDIGDSCVSVGEDRQTLKRLKQMTFAETIKLLREPIGETNFVPGESKL